jgi:hypothetical protein
MEQHDIANSKWIKYQPGVEWVDVNIKRPKIGEIVFCKVNIWKSAQLHHTEEIKAKYIGYNNKTERQMFDIDAGVESYPEVTFWRNIKN